MYLVNILWLRIMYRSNRSFNIPPGQPPGLLTFLKIVFQIPPSPSQNAVQMPHTRVHSGDQMPPPRGHFTGTWMTEGRQKRLQLSNKIFMGAIHSTKIPTGPTGKRGPPQKVDPFFRNFSGWTEPIHWVLDRNFRKFWLNGSRPINTMVSGQPEKAADISWRHHWFPREITSEKRAQKFHTGDVSLPSLIGWSKFPTPQDQSKALPRCG